MTDEELRAADLEMAQMDLRNAQQWAALLHSRRRLWRFRHRKWTRQADERVETAAEKLRLLRIVNE